MMVEIKLTPHSRRFFILFRAEDSHFNDQKKKVGGMRVPLSFVYDRIKTWRKPFNKGTPITAARWMEWVAANVATVKHRA
ncbi:hypothetical protein GT3921_10030 [Geobacillus thermocatenulatus]|nr:hypothetical protein GT3921_10030 [Geobacillus thermocatenulatus]